MKIHLLDQIWSFANDNTEIDSIVDTIQNYVNSNNLFIQQIIIDSEELNEDFSEYLIDHIRNIENIYVQVATNQQFSDQLIITSRDYLIDSLPEITNFANNLYKGLSEEMWNTMSNFLEGMQYIIRTIETITSSSHSYTSFASRNEFQTELNSKLHELMEASLKKDNSLMADLIIYEIKPLLENLIDSFNHTIDSEVKRNDLQ